jgi:tetratricopeptide (TPR) repeat protein
MRTWLMLVTMGIACVASMPRGVAAEADAEEARPPEVREAEGNRAEENRRRADLRRQWALLREANRKQQAGEALNDEERAALERARQFQRNMRERVERQRREEAERREQRVRELTTGREGLVLDDRLNLLDAAYYRIAEIHLSRNQIEQAVTALEQLIRKSPDKNAVALTHLNLAELYRRRLNNKERAVAEYKRVTGVYAADALKRLATLFEEAKQIDEAVEQLDTLARDSKDGLQKLAARQELADLLMRNDRPDEAIATLQQLIGSVTYEEAVKATEMLSDEFEYRRRKAEAGPPAALMNRRPPGARGRRNDD